MIYRSDQALIVVTFKGVTIDSNPWDLWEDGQKKTEGLKVFPGGMKDGVELGGTPTREPLKLGRKWDDSLIGAYKSLEEICGNGEMEASRTTYKTASQSAGGTITLTGMLLEVGPVLYKAGPSEELMLMVTMGTNVGGG